MTQHTNDTLVTVACTNCHAPFQMRAGDTKAENYCAACKARPWR